MALPTLPAAAAALAALVWLLPGPLVWTPPPSVQPASRIDPAGEPLPPRALWRGGTTRFAATRASIAGFARGDAALVLADDRERRVKVVDASSGELLHAFPIARREAAGGDRVACVERQGVDVYDARTGALVHSLLRPGMDVDEVRFSGDGGRIFAWEQFHHDFPFAVIDAASGKTLATVKPAEVLAAAKLAPGTFAGFSGDGAQVAVSGLDAKAGVCRLLVIDAITRKEVRRCAWPRYVDAWMPFQAGAGSAVTSPGLDRAAILGAEADQGKLVLWDLGAGKAIRAVPPRGWRTAAFTPDGKQVVAVADGALVFLDAASGKELGAAPLAASASSREVVFSASGARAAVVDAGGTARAFDVASRSEVRRAVDGLGDGVRELRFTRDGARLDGRWAGSRASLDARTGAAQPGGGALEEPALRLEVREGAVAVLKKGEATAAATLGKARHKDLQAAALTPDGAAVATVGSAPVMRTYDLRARKEGQALDKAGQHGTSVLYSEDGKLLAATVLTEMPAAPDKPSGWMKAEVRVWDAATGKRRGGCELPAGWGINHSGDSWSGGPLLVAITADGARAAVRYGEEPSVFDLATGKEIAKLSRAAHVGLSCGALSPDGSRLATGGDEGTVLLWSLDGEGR